MQDNQCTCRAGSSIWETAAVPGDPAPGQVLPFHEGFHADDQEASGRSQPGNVRQRWRFNKYIDEIQPNLDKMKVVF